MSISRRNLLKGSIGGLALFSPFATALAQSKSTQYAPLPWKNWAGNVSCIPSKRATPKNIDALAQTIKSSTGTIRGVGAGHSWSPLVPTDDTLISLRRIRGLVSHEKETLSATFGAGTKLSSLGQALDDIGQGMINMPDIDEQTLAGAFSTGTHGTGLELPALHDSVEGITLVSSDGKIIECSRSNEPEIFHAAKVSLGALGIITEYKLKNTHSYKVRKRNWIAELDDLMEGGEAAALAKKHRHFEFFYIPFSNYALCHSIDQTEDANTELPPPDDNQVLAAFKMIRDAYAEDSALRQKELRELIESVEVPPELVERSWKLLSSDRTYPIYEMEYQVPIEYGPKAFREIIEYIESHHPELYVPLEYRYVAADDAWLSEFYKRPSVSISVHRVRDEGDPWTIFKEVQNIFLKYDGRPHWGKVHNLEHGQLAELYPMMGEFNRVRKELDPKGQFSNLHIKNILG